MTVKMIVAVDQGNAIGHEDGRLPWKIPADLKRFKELTTGSTVLMGRKTYQSLGRPNGLPNRKNLVLTRRPYSEVRGQFGEVDIVSGLEYVRPWLGVEGDDLWIIGGAAVYAEALEKQFVDEIYVTQVHVNSGALVSLPFDLFGWKLFVLREQKRGVLWQVRIDDPVPADGDTPAYTYLTFTKHQ